MSGNRQADESPSPAGAEASVTDPTPEEIRERCLAIQESWSDWQRQRRGEMRREWAVPRTRSGE